MPVQPNCERAGGRAVLNNATRRWRESRMNFIYLYSYVKSTTTDCGGEVSDLLPVVVWLKATRCIRLAHKSVPVYSRGNGH